jgi:HD-like signal output (HDOD) protein
MSLPITTFSSTEAPLSAADVIAGARQLGASGGGPGTARLLAVLIDPLAELDEVLSTLHGEPALAARVLKVANAPLYGRSGQVGTLEHAVQMLGLDAVRGICAACCMDRTPIAGNPGGLDPRQFRLHSLAAAFAGQRLARALAPALEAQAFMAGLLHDIGLVLMARLRPQTLAALADQQPPADAEAEIAFERQHAGLSHDACAGHLAAAWGLPVWLIEAVGAHHAFPCSTDPLEPPALTLARLVQAADALAHHAGFGLRASCAQALAWPQLGLGADDALIDSIVAALPDQIGAVMDAGP